MAVRTVSAALRPLSVDQIRRLRARALAVGEVALLEKMEMSKIALLRALAGLSVRPGTRALIERELNHTDQEAPSCAAAQ